MSDLYRVQENGKPKVVDGKFVYAVFDDPVPRDARFPDLRDWEEDLETLSTPLPPSSEVRVALHIDEVDREHGRHKAIHPWCIGCEVDRQDRLWIASGVPSFEERPDEQQDIHIRIARDTCLRRARYHFVRNGSMPEHDEGKSLAAEVLDRGQIDDLPTPDPLIDGVLNRHSYAVLRGRDGTYKTFIALDWSLCLATGKRWQEKPAEQARVLYIAGEGAYGLAPRIAAWEYAWGTKVDPEWFHVLPRAVNLFRGAEFAALERVVQDGGYSLVVVDTLRRAAGGADGNSSDMGVVVDRLERIKRATKDGSVLVIAHTDKGDNDTRGYSGIEDDADIVWHAKRDDESPAVTLKNTKMKDGPDGLTVELSVLAIDDSLVLQGGDRTRAEVVETNRQARHLLAVMRHSFAGVSATGPELLAASDLPKSTFYRAIGDLKKNDLIVNTGTRKTPRWEPSPESESQAVWDCDSQLVPTPAPRLTSTFPTVPSESQTSPKSSPTVPHPLRGGTGTSGGTTTEEIAI